MCLCPTDFRRYIGVDQLKARGEVRANALKIIHNYIADYDGFGGMFNYLNLLWIILNPVLKLRPKTGQRIMCNGQEA